MHLQDLIIALLFTSSAVLCCAMLCCAMLCCAVLCCAVLCCAVLCHVTPRYAMLPSVSVVAKAAEYTHGHNGNQGLHAEQ